MAIITVLGIVITAAYIMRVIRGVFFGDMPQEFEGHIAPIKIQDKVALVMLSGLLILIGVVPAVIAPLISSGADAVMRLVGGI